MIILEFKQPILLIYLDYHFLICVSEYRQGVQCCETDLQNTKYIPKALTLLK